MTDMFKKNQGELLARVQKREWERGPMGRGNHEDWKNHKCGVLVNKVGGFLGHTFNL